MDFLALNLSMYAEEILRKKRIPVSTYLYANFYTSDCKSIIIEKLKLS